MTLLRLDPPIPLHTPKGEGLAHFIDDLGVENEAQWVVFVTATGEIWWVSNSEVRATENWSVGRVKPTANPQVPGQSKLHRDIAQFISCEVTKQPCVSPDCVKSGQCQAAGRLM